MSEVTRRLRLLALGMSDEIKKRIADDKTRIAHHQALVDDNEAKLQTLKEIEELIQQQMQDEPTNPGSRSQELRAISGPFQKVGSILEEGKKTTSIPRRSERPGKR